MIRPAWMSQFSQCFRLYLSNTFPGYIKLFANFLQGVIGIHADAKPHLQYFRFAFGK